VLAREDTPGDARLVAYLVGREVDPAVLRDRLRKTLPEYMIPSAFVVLSDLPRTPNGKVDRAALPAPEAGRAAVAAPFVAPRSPVEAALSAVWAEVLSAPQVGVLDDFFELGGHSILAVRLVARLEETFQVRIGLRTLFDAPTVAGLAAALRADPEAAQQLERAVQLLREMEELSDREIEAELGRKRPAPE
jgi:acyl carrier protein